MSVITSQDSIGASKHLRSEQDIDLVGFASQIIATVIAGALLSSGFIHMLNPYLFLRTIYSYGIVNAILGQFAAVWLPFLQIAIGACLLFRVAIPAASLMSVGLFSLFVVAQSVAYFGNAAISCGCFGFSTKAIGIESLSIVSSLLIVSLFVFWNSLQGTQGKPMAPANSLTAD